MERTCWKKEYEIQAGSCQRRLLSLGTTTYKAMTLVDVQSKPGRRHCEE